MEAISDANALQLCARFALPPNSLGYCGKNSAPEKFKKCFIDSDCAGVKKELKKFIVLYPYLKTISQITKLPKYSYKVVESYWLGNGLLNKAQPEHYSLLLANFLEQGVPDFFVEELKDNTPKKFLPFHLFQVLHVGVGKASGAVPFNLESINNCMIRWGKVRKISQKDLSVELNSLEKEKGNYKLTGKEETISYNKDFLPNLEIGKKVAVHWQQPMKILLKEEVKNLEFWTKEVLRTLSY